MQQPHSKRTVSALYSATRTTETWLFLDYSRSSSTLSPCMTIFSLPFRSYLRSFIAVFIFQRIYRRYDEELNEILREKKHRCSVDELKKSISRSAIECIASAWCIGTGCTRESRGSVIHDWHGRVWITRSAVVRCKCFIVQMERHGTPFPISEGKKASKSAFPLVSASLRSSDAMGTSSAYRIGFIGTVPKGQPSSR